MEEAEIKENPYESVWFGKLEPTGELTSFYPFNRFGEIEGYLPGTMPNEIMAEKFSHYLVWYKDRMIGKVEAATYDELIALSGDDCSIECYYMIADSEGNLQEQCIVEYAISDEALKEGNLESSLGENLIAGNYQIAISGSGSGNGLGGNVFGLEKTLFDAELMDVIIKEWGMPSYAYLTAVSNYGDCTGVLIWDVGEYAVALSVLSSGEDSAKIVLAHVYGANKDLEYMYLEDPRISGYTNWQP